MVNSVAEAATTNLKRPSELQFVTTREKNMGYPFRTPSGLITADRHETIGSLLQRGALPDKWCVIRSRAFSRVTPNNNRPSSAATGR